jgi:hypothetical protein
MLFGLWMESGPYIILKWRLHSALLLASDARLLQIELPLDTPARLVGDSTVTKQPMDVFALGSNQFRPDVRSCGSGFDPI